MADLDERPQVAAGDRASESSDPWIGKYVIVRCRDAGVHAGTLKSREGRQCELTDSRRLWRWRVNGNKGITLSDVATVGLDTKDSKIGAPVTILLTEDCEIIECTPEAAENIAQFPTHEPR
jgi:hypothetical protein